MIPQEIQKGLNSCQFTIGITRLTRDTIKKGPQDLEQHCFNAVISQFVESFTIADSLDGSYRTCEMILNDLYNMREIVPFTGTEIISIYYKNVLAEDQPNSRKLIHFSIHSISEIPVETALSAGHKKLNIKLVEFPIYNFLIANQYYKTYPINANNKPNLKFSDIVKDQLSLVPNFYDWYDIDIEDSTSNAISFYVPNWSILKTINYCRKYAVSQKDNMGSYVFHVGKEVGRSKPVIYFKPVLKFVNDINKSRVYGTSYQDVGRKQGSYNPIDTIQSYIFKYHDAQKVSVMSGNTEVTFDYLKDNLYISSDYDDFLKNKYRGLNNYPIYPTSNGNMWSTFHRSAFNQEEAKINLKNELFNEYANNLLYNSVSCIAQCHISEARNVGERAELIFNVADTEKVYDKMFSGSWITWSSVDAYVNGIATSTVTFINDGFNDILDPSNTFQTINTITGEKAPEKVKQG